MEFVDFSRFVFSLGAVVAMIWLTAYILKRTGLDQRLRGVTKREGRLAIVDVIHLDARRKLTLVRADTREYLILFTGDTAQVVDHLPPASKP
jgi:flagellar protein FliO/FliZ